MKIAIERKKKRGKKGRKARFAKVTTISRQKKSGRQSTAFSGRVKGKAPEARQVPGDDHRHRHGRADVPAAKLSFRIVSG